PAAAADRRAGYVAGRGGDVDAGARTAGPAVGGRRPVGPVEPARRGEGAGAAGRGGADGRAMGRGRRDAAQTAIEQSDRQRPEVNRDRIARGADGDGAGSWT